MRNKKNKYKELSFLPMEELLPTTLHGMETLWNMSEEKRNNRIKLEDDRNSRLLKKKLKDEYESN